MAWNINNLISMSGHFLFQDTGVINMDLDKGNFAGLVLVFFAFWLAVSGSFHWQQMVLGLAVALFVAYFNRNLLITPGERPRVSLRTIVLLMVYGIKLLGGIVKANFQLAWLVLHPRLPITPGMKSLEVPLDKIGSRVLLGNSITLTPGTLTVLADEKRFLVHTITAESSDELDRWPFIARLKQIEEDGK